MSGVSANSGLLLEIWESRFGPIQWRKHDFHIGKYRFCSVLYMKDVFRQKNAMPCGTFEELVGKYKAFFFVRPFAAHNMSVLRLWMDGMVRRSKGCVIDWKGIDAKAHEKLLMLSNLNIVALRLQLSENLKAAEFNG